jgi:hypothetical protein
MEENVQEVARSYPLCCQCAPHAVEGTEALKESIIDLTARPIDRLGSWKPETHGRN